MTMTIPFRNLFKRKPVKEAPVPAPAAPPIEKPISERLSKTVLPNSVRSVGQGDPFDQSTQSRTGHASGPRVAFSMNTGGLPPAVALALEPKVERAISLDLADVVAQMPDGLIRPLQEGDAGRRVLLKAAEIEKGMSTGKPTVSVATIYQQIPEIFLHTVPGTDARQVHLPLAKVLEQFSKLQLRDDQYRDQSVPQVETPFLQMTLEDNTRFGITMEPIQTGEMPPVRLQPATAESLAAFEPDFAFREKSPLNTPPRALTPLRVRLPAEAKQAPASPPPSPKTNAPPAPARIPFKLTPNGTDVPAPERVPASSGPSVSTTAPTPTRIPFKVSPPNETPAAKPEPWLTKESFDGNPEAKAATEIPASELHQNGSEFGRSEIKISLPLKPILQSLPPFQLTGDITGVSDAARLELPFSLVESQLVTGRVTLTPDQFAAALPEEYRGLFSSAEIAAPVALSLQEVLKNLPAASLRVRDDQIEQEESVDFVTPFSAKAEEDAKRFNGTGVAVPLVRPTIEPPAPTLGAKLPEPKKPFAFSPPAVATPEVTSLPVNHGGRTALQEAFDTDDELDAKAVVGYLDKLPGVQACALMFADGLSLAGSLPEEYAAEGLCALAPSLILRLEDHVAETKLGGLSALTISCAQAAITFFSHENLCLAALHAQGELAAHTRERLASAVEELSRKYSHPG